MVKKEIFKVGDMIDCDGEVLEILDIKRDHASVMEVDGEVIKNFKLNTEILPKKVKKQRYTIIKDE